MIVRAIDYEAMPQSCIDKGSSGDREIDTEDQAFAADFPNELKPRGQFLQARAKFGAARLHIGK
jgi:hypothetical protein